MRVNTIITRDAKMQKKVNIRDRKHTQRQNRGRHMIQNCKKGRKGGAKVDPKADSIHD